MAHNFDSIFKCTKMDQVSDLLRILTETGVWW